MNAIDEDKTFNEMMGIKATSEIAYYVVRRYGNDQGWYVDAINVLQVESAKTLFKKEDKFSTKEEAQAEAEKRTAAYKESLMYLTPVEGSTFPTEARLPGNSNIRALIKWLRDVEVDLPKCRMNRLTGNEGCATHYIDNILHCATSGRIRKQLVDDRIFDWTQQMAVKVNDRILELLQHWLAKKLAMKDPYYIKV